MLLARSYSHYTLLHAVPKIPELISAAKKAGYTTVAITDEGTASGLAEFYEECIKQDINPALGSTLNIKNSITSRSYISAKEYSSISLIAKNQKGYIQLLELITIARTEKENPLYHIELSDIKSKDNGENLFIVFNQEKHKFYDYIINGDSNNASKILEYYLKSMKTDSLLVELIHERASLSKEDVTKYNKIVVNLCDQHSIRYIASTGPRYVDSGEEEAFRIVQAIDQGRRLAEVETDYDYEMKTVEYLNNYYKEFNLKDTKDIEESINVILRTDYDSNASEAFFPEFDLPEGQEYSQRLIWETYSNFVSKYHPVHKKKSQVREEFPYERLKDLKEFARNFKIDPKTMEGYPDEHFETHNTKMYLDRIEYELDIIITKGYPSYFLVFADIMRFCRDNGIVVSTRGSAAGSLVGYILEINILDPLVYEIPFERFLNPLRPSAPDIDGDFADDRRAEVIQYIKEKYGDLNVTQIITYGTMLPRAVVRDVGRALGVSYKKCDALAKAIPIAPQGSKASFEWAFEASEELMDIYNKDSEVKRIIDIAKYIEGNFRHASSHAAGVIITPTKMTDYSAVQWDSDHAMKICQYDMRYSEKVGLIKLDILGIRNLAILGRAIEMAEERGAEKIDLLKIDVENKKAFDLLAKGKTMGVFQLSGGGMTRFLVDLEPSKVQDLMAMVALYRPGPMANIPEYIKRKKNPKRIKYYVPQMKEWMEESYGVLVYQDDLLYTVINIAGYDWLEADKFRKGVGKKIKAVIDAQKPKFIKGAIEKSGMTKNEATALWEIIEPFAAYGFNKAHASNYGMVAYWTAYMKAEYPAEFMTALMSAESSNLDKIGEAINECDALSLNVPPPDVNRSYEGFYIENDDTIRYGLDTVKNLGKDVVKYMIQERQKNGKFVSINDFLERMSAFKGFNKKSLEALIWSGSLDELGLKEIA